MTNFVQKVFRIHGIRCWLERPDPPDKSGSGGYRENGQRFSKGSFGDSTSQPLYNMIHYL